jgi:hypothetical protein
LTIAFHLFKFKQVYCRGSVFFGSYQLDMFRLMQVESYQCGSLAACLQSLNTF